MIIYVDTSAVLKLVVEESESAAAAEYFSAAASRNDRLVASMLLYTGSTAQRTGVVLQASWSMRRSAASILLTLHDPT